MTMTRQLAFWAVSILILLSSVGGCSDETGRLSWDNSFKDAFAGSAGGNPSDMAMDPNDADKRRLTIVKMSSVPWGLKEPYTKFYAAALAGDRDALVRASAATALGKAGDSNYVDALAAAMNDPSPAVRWDAAIALDKVKGESAVEPLRRHAFDDESADVRAACAKALRHYRSTEVGNTLVKCLDDGSFGVRHRAHATLVELTGQDVGFGSFEWAKLVADGVMTRPPATSKAWYEWTWGLPKTPTSRPK